MISAPGPPLVTQPDPLLKPVAVSTRCFLMSAEARAILTESVLCPFHAEPTQNHYNNVRLNSATGYITPKDMLVGRQQDIHAERDRKLEAARKQRQIRRKQDA
jgi:hypothetical protein